MPVLEHLKSDSFWVRAAVVVTTIGVLVAIWAEFHDPELTQFETTRSEVLPLDLSQQDEPSRSGTSTDTSKDRPVLTESDVRRIAYESIAITYETSISSIRDSADFSIDFGQEESFLGDLRFVELFILFEERAGCTIEDDIALTVVTVADFIAVALPRCSNAG